jgi:cytochrome P450
MTKTPADTPTLLSLQTPEINGDPYPLYDRLRTEAPVQWDDQLQEWVLTSYEEVLLATRDPRFSAVRVGVDVDWLPSEYREAAAPAFHAIARQILFLDPPDHTRIRGLVQKAFTPRAIEQLRHRIEAVVRELLDAVEGDTMDVVAELAFPLPSVVIAEMLGVPPEDRERFRAWSENFGAVLGGTEMSSEEAAGHFVGVSEFVEYFRGIVEEHRRSPKDDILQGMIDAGAQGDRLTEEELFGNAVLLIAAGHLTTTGLIGNGVLTLLLHPEARAALRANPELMPGAIEEMLRYESPVQATGRRLLEDVELRGEHLRAGDSVLLHLGAANRDPARFADPARFDITRQNNRHLAFSQGIHFCLGAVLARLEGQTAIAALLERFPNLTLEGDPPPWESDFLFRGVASLRVRLR